MDERYIPRDVPQEIKECYGRRPVRKRAPQSTPKLKTSTSLLPKKPETPDLPTISPCPPPSPLAIEKEKPAEEVQQHSSDNTRSHEQVLRTKLSQEGGNDEDLKSMMNQPRPKASCQTFNSHSRVHTSDDPKKTSPEKPKIMQSSQWPDKDILSSLEGIWPNHDDLISTTTCSIFLTHQGPTVKKESTQNGLDLTITKITNRVIQNCPISDLSLFGSLQSYLWRPGVFSYDLKAPCSVLRCP